MQLASFKPANPQFIQKNHHVPKGLRHRARLNTLFLKKITEVDILTGSNVVFDDKDGGGGVERLFDFCIAVLR